MSEPTWPAMSGTGMVWETEELCVRETMRDSGAHLIVETEGVCDEMHVDGPDAGVARAWEVLDRSTVRDLRDALTEWLERVS